ncbi:MAG: AAA family ATPase, partial [Eubacteriaceae bacterium]|nr:AAA family ATPase [Eubacteriaceae bacterium]
MAIFGRFTDKAQKVLLLSQEEAKKLYHNYIGSEHLLLGLIREGEGIAAIALKNLGVQYDKVYKEIETLLGKGEEPVNDIIGYTPRTKKILELSLMEARALNQSYIGTEHILLGLAREGEGVGAKILSDQGLDFEKIREEIVNLMNATPSSSPKAAQAKSSSTPNLDKYGRDLTEMAREGRLDPVIGREKEIERVIQILSRRTKNNPVLIGEPGVGKTAIAEGLAQKIVAGNIPENLKDKRVVSLDLSSMVAGAKYRGEFEDRLKNVMEEIREADNILLFIDEMHTIIGAGAAEGAIDASNILKPALARGELQAIGATTLDEYRKHVEKDAALERRFMPVEVGEPSKEEALEILKGLRDKYEAHHKVTITDEGLKAAVELSDRYINDRFLPDKAIDLIDEAASKVRLNILTAPPDMKVIEGKIEKCEQEKEEAVASQDYEKAAEIRDKENKLKEDLKTLKESWKQKNNIGTGGEVGAEEIAQIISSWTGVPVRKLAQEESDRLLHM